MFELFTSVVSIVLPLLGDYDRLAAGALVRTGSRIFRDNSRSVLANRPVSLFNMHVLPGRVGGNKPYER